MKPKDFDYILSASKENVKFFNSLKKSSKVPDGDYYSTENRSTEEIQFDGASLYRFAYRFGANVDV